MSESGAEADKGGGKKSDDGSESADFAFIPLDEARRLASQLLAQYHEAFQILRDK